MVKGRDPLAEHKRPFAHDHPGTTDFAEAIAAIRPTAIIGVCGMPRMFTRPVLEAMTSINDRPIVFALSNPTSKSECTARQAYRWTHGHAVFASGSPFDAVTLEGRTFIPGQGNNAYIFPGVGLGAIASATRHVTDDMFIAAARTLADEVSEEDLRLGRIYPSLDRIRAVSARIGAAVAEVAYDRGLAEQPRPANLHEAIEAQMFEPDYAPTPS